MRGRGRLSALAATVLLLGCASDELVDDRFSKQEWEYLQTFRLPAVAPCPGEWQLSSEGCDAAGVLGQRLFFDPSYAGPLCVASDLGSPGETGAVSCASCHAADVWFSDARSIPNTTSLGADRTLRNSPSLVNAALHGTFAWDGRYPTMASVLEVALVGQATLNSDRLTLATRILDGYRAEYDLAFDPDLPATAGELDGPTIDTIFTNVSRALEAYQRLLVSGNSPFDRYLDGDEAALSEGAKRGLKLFIGPAMCSECHSGPAFSDGRFHNSGLTPIGAEDDCHAVMPPAMNPGTCVTSTVQDCGRVRVTGEAADRGSFRTPGLRQVAETGPYMHAGQLATLEDVMDFYRRGGDASGFVGEKDRFLLPLELDDQDAQDLVELLRALTGDEIPERLRGPVSAP
jgi:cytochrome c peroxidase